MLFHLPDHKLTKLPILLVPEPSADKGLSYRADQSKGMLYVHLQLRTKNKDILRRHLYQRNNGFLGNPLRILTRILRSPCFHLLSED